MQLIMNNIVGRGRWYRNHKYVFFFFTVSLIESIEKSLLHNRNYSLVANYQTFF